MLFQFRQLKNIAGYGAEQLDTLLSTLSQTTERSVHRGSLTDLLRLTSPFPPLVREAVCLRSRLASYRPLAWPRMTVHNSISHTFYAGLSKPLCSQGPSSTQGQLEGAWWTKGVDSLNLLELCWLDSRSDHSPVWLGQTERHVNVK